MATMEDRLLGEKLHYYCSSSEGEEEEDKDDVQVAEDGFDVDKSRNTQADKIAERAYMEVSGNSLSRFNIFVTYGAKTKLFAHITVSSKETRMKSRALFIERTNITVNTK